MKKLEFIQFYASWKKGLILKGHSLEYPIDLEVETGKWIYIIGLNGIGKSTLVKAIAGIVKVIKGEVFFDNNMVPLFNLQERYKLDFCYVPQHENFGFDLNWNDVIDYTKRPMESDDVLQLRNVLREIGILEINDYFRNYRLFDITAAILMKPRVLILDEILPAFFGIEQNLINSPYRFIRSLLPETIVFFTEHDINIGFEAMDEILWLTENKKPIHYRCPNSLEIQRLKKELSYDFPLIEGSNELHVDYLKWKEVINLENTPIDNIKIALRSLGNNAVILLEEIFCDFPFLNSNKPAAELSGGQRLVLIWFMLEYTRIGVVPNKLVQHLDPRNKELIINKWKRIDE